MKLTVITSAILLFFSSLCAIAQNVPYANKPSIAPGTYYSWNLALNSGFEMASEHWKASESAILETISEHPYSAIWSAKVSQRTNNTDGITQDISDIVTQKGAGKYWLGAAVRLAQGTDSVILKLQSGATILQFKAQADTNWTYVHFDGLLPDVDAVSTLSICTQQSTSDIFIDEVWMRYAENLSKYAFTYPATYPLVQSFRQNGDNENAYFPILYNMFNSSVLQNNQNTPGKILIGQSSWGAILAWGKLQYDKYPYEKRGSFFPGWYTYYEGTNLSADLPVDATSAQVANGGSIMKAGNGNYFDAAIIARNSDGTPNWNKVEHIKISAVSGNTLSISRAEYSSPTFAFTANDHA